MVNKDDRRGIFGCASRFTSEGPRAPAFPSGLLVHIRRVPAPNVGNVEWGGDLLSRPRDGISRSNAGRKHCGKFVRLIPPEHRTAKIRTNVPEFHHQDLEPDRGRRHYLNIPYRNKDVIELHVQSRSVIAVGFPSNHPCSHENNRTEASTCLTIYTTLPEASVAQ